MMGMAPPWLWVSGDFRGRGNAEARRVRVTVRVALTNVTATGTVKVAVAVAVVEKLNGGVSDNCSNRNGGSASDSRD